MGEISKPPVQLSEPVTSTGSPILRVFPSGQAERILTLLDHLSGAREALRIYSSALLYVSGCNFFLLCMFIVMARYTHAGAPSYSPLWIAALTIIAIVVAVRYDLTRRRGDALFHTISAQAQTLAVDASAHRLRSIGEASAYSELVVEVTHAISAAISAYFTRSDLLFFQGRNGVPFYVAANLSIFIAYLLLAISSW